MHEPSPDLLSIPIEKEHAESDRELAEITGYPIGDPCPSKCLLLIHDAMHLK